MAKKNAILSDGGDSLVRLECSQLKIKFKCRRGKNFPPSFYLTKER
jgi:hypothetical protein